MIKAILFDFDGVLTTLFSGSYATALYISEKLGLNVDEVFNKRKLYIEDVNSGKLDGKDVLRKVLSEFGATLNEDMLHEAYLSTPLDDKMFAYARELKKEYMVGILTDDDAERFDMLAAKYNLKEEFACYY